ncbi:hypothetical protein JTT01_06385 [Clostridium botulinum]|nr:hypothetical protein [Clostridium botulinum]
MSIKENKILPEETIELIATYIFELNSVEELENILVFLIQKFYLTMELKSWRKSRAFLCQILFEYGNIFIGNSI